MFADGVWMLSDRRSLLFESSIFWKQKPNRILSSKILSEKGLNKDAHCDHFTNEFMLDKYLNKILKSCDGVSGSENERVRLFNFL